MRLEGKVALVTGAGQGIGRGIALVLASEGANVVINDINLETATNTANEIKAMGRQSLAVKADASSSAEVNQMVTRVLETFGRIDILVNNTGIGTGGSVVKLAEADWDRVFAVNLKAYFLCCQAVGRQMIKQKSGKIVNVASISARFGTPRMAAYCASKAGVVQLTRVMALEVAKDGITVNSVSPGPTLTPMAESAEKVNPDYFARYLERIPARRRATPEEIGKAVLFLVSSEANYINGHDLVVDGGLIALDPGYPSPKS